MTKFCISRSAVSRSACEGMAQSPKDPHAVAAIVHSLRRVRGDPIARYNVTKDMTPAALVDTLLRPPLNNGQP
jgi:hypothetical protein